MLKKSARLSRTEFTEYFKKGKRFQSPVLTLIYSPHKELHGSVVVGKKVAKTAVRRNALRRRIYEQLRRYAKEHNITGVFIVITKPPFNSLTRQQAQIEIKKLLQKVNL